MAATLTSKASSLLRAHSDEVHGIADCHRAIGDRLWVVAFLLITHHPSLQKEGRRKAAFFIIPNGGITNQGFDQDLD